MPRKKKEETPQWEYKPTKLMAKGSHYDKDRADRVVRFIKNLNHTKGEFFGKPFILLPWQEQLIRDIFGVVKADGTRQFRYVYVEIAKKQGKSELASAIALYMLCADGEQRAEVYGAAADRAQASIVYETAADMVNLCPALAKRIKVLPSKKNMLYEPTNSKYQVLSAEAFTKHGLNVSAVIFDELHAQPDRRLYDVLTFGSGDARKQPLYFMISTAGNDVHSIGYEVHQKTRDVLEGKKVDPAWYGVLYSADESDDWTNPKTWYKANPSLGITVSEDSVRTACESAKQNPAEENSFRQLRLCQWVKQSIRWMPMAKWDACKRDINIEELRNRVCFGGLDLSTTTDMTSFVLVFPPRTEDEPYIVLPYYWVPQDGMDLRVLRDKVPYNIWAQQGYLEVTDGNVIHYDAIEQFIKELSETYLIREICYDRWGATQVSQDLENMGISVVPFGQGFQSMSPPTKELYKLVLEQKIVHNGHPILRWNFDNATVRQDPAGNLKLDKEKSTEKIDGAVATVMALDRAIRVGNDSGASTYDSNGLFIL